MIYQRKSGCHPTSKLAKSLLSHIALFILTLRRGVWIEWLVGMLYYQINFFLKLGVVNIRDMNDKKMQ